MAARAPKQWTLTKQETITSFESWRQNLQYILSLDANFAPFLVDDVTWLKKTPANPLRGMANDGEEIPENNRRTGAQKVTHLELMLGQIANYCPIISRNTFVKNSTSMNSIWQAIRMHYGFQSTGGHLLDFNNIHLEPGERPEDLYQRLTSFVEDNLLLADGQILHHGEAPEVDEEISPTLENLVVLTWLRLIHQDLPALVKQRYGTELRSKTLASLKPEISQALDSLLDQIYSATEAKVLRTAFRKQAKVNPVRPNRPAKSCPLCKQAGRPKYDHYLSGCKYLPAEDRNFMTSRARQLAAQDNIEQDSEDCHTSDDEVSVTPSSSVGVRITQVPVPTTRRVSTKQSPQMKVFHHHHTLNITLDTGAEISMIKTSVAEYIGANIKKTSQHALQADGVTPLSIVGETHLQFTRDDVTLHMEALVVNDIDVDILAGIPFMTVNDITLRPAKNQIIIGDSHVIYYKTMKDDTPQHRVRRAQGFVLRAPPVTTTVWPGSFLEVDIPTDMHPEDTVAIEPRTDRRGPSICEYWPQPAIMEAVGGKVRIVNATKEPQVLRRNEHFCEVRMTSNNSAATAPDTCISPSPTTFTPRQTSKAFSEAVQVDPDGILADTIRKNFNSLLRDHDTLFDPKIETYNDAAGKFQCTINMGPTQPPQRKGRVPQYSRDKLVTLQQKCDELESLGVLRKPEEVGVTVEYVNPSFLVGKPNGGHRLVTAFEDVGRYSKPQPSLMPDVDSTLRTIGQWRYIIKTDLTSAFYQISLSKASMKYCGVVTPYRGVRVYTRCAMGMPGSETALEELMCRVLGDCLQDGIVAKLADDLYCGADSPEQLLDNWKRVMTTLQSCNLRLSPSKTIICPRSTTILGWVWTQGNLSASSHKVAALSSCKTPDTVHGLRSFIGAYKVLSRVLPGCSQTLAPLEDAIAGLQSKDKLHWTESLLAHFSQAQTSLSKHKAITLPIPSDTLWIVTDGAVSTGGLGATLYVMRKSKLHLAGFFSAKLRKHQVTWLPCEVEALCIAAAVKHFSPFIIQSRHQACVLTDSKPCVQAIDKLSRGEFSASPRVTSFLSVASRYQVSVRHLAGSSNVPSDFSSRNAPECGEAHCQICNFVLVTSESVVRSVSVHDILSNMKSLPFTTRSAWLAIQADCSDLRRTCAHLKQGTRPSKKLTNIKDVKRYLNVATIARDGVLIVRRNDPLQPTSELVVVPRQVLDGLVTALHIKLDHPSRHQLQLIMKRHFFALDMTKAVERVSDTCHTCASLSRFPDALIEQSTDDPAESVGVSFAADVIKRHRQLVLVLRETTTSYTRAMVISDEKRDTLRDALVQLLAELHPLDGPPAVVRVDPAPGFSALRNDETLQRLRITLEIGRVKNVNKNPVAEKAVRELGDELLRQEPGGGPVSEIGLAIAVARLNARIRSSGLSARELWTQRSQFTHEQLPVSDRDNILKQHTHRESNHDTSAKSKSKRGKGRVSPTLCVGDLVYLYCDKDKSKGRCRYLVTSISGEWCTVKKFTGSQLRTTSYKVKLRECYRVPCEISLSDPSRPESDTDEPEDAVVPAVDNPSAPTPVEIPDILCNPHAHQENDPVYPGAHPASVDFEDDFDFVTENPITPDSGGSEPTPSDCGSPLVATRPRRERKLPSRLDDYVLY